MKRLIIFMLMLSVFSFAFGPPVAHADNFTITSYAAIIPSATSGHATILGYAAINPSDYFAIGNYYFGISLETSAYVLENATCMSAVSPVVKMPFVADLGSHLWIELNDDAITASSANTAATNNAETAIMNSAATKRYSATSTPAPEVVLKMMDDTHTSYMTYTLKKDLDVGDLPAARDYVSL